MVLTVVLALGPMLASCSCGANASAEATAQARLFRPPPGKASVYVLRRWGNKTSCYRVTGDRLFEAQTAGGSTVSRIHAILRNESFCVFHVQPGRREISVQDDAWWPPWITRPTVTLTFMAKSGTCYFVHYGLREKFPWLEYLELLDAGIGRRLAGEFAMITTKAEVE
jgi:hypothetical protein